MTTCYFTAVTLDGFLATPEHSLEWLFACDFDWAAPMPHATFADGVGVLVMGASTYEWMLRRDEPWPYEQPTWVLTHRDLPVPGGADVRLTQADVRDVHAEMTVAADGGVLWVMGGGVVAQQFADAGLLDEVWLQYAPVFIGVGHPVFTGWLDLELIDVERNRDFMCGRYRVRRPSA